MSKEVDTYLPSFDGQSGVEITWSTDCKKAFDSGIKLAQFWLDSACNGWLWAVMIAERDLLPRAIDRRAFEVGFLGRVHQRLCSHEAGRQSAEGVALGHAQPERRPPAETACRC
ncbi:hypothetical protein BVH01_22940 [Pseudomonas sp. PA1(2017)]|uniref:LasR-specific antiactivator QslA n=1 Tax=Pseudomonas sp. PA1(2017) TaxID=1932113 RepID=UPI0009643615|nr:LasR-specific antiactivator QslA [Pseudomonas sp. PA1(2017)]OLU13206.1 hypothetical protein BVH01_22940 [Pseudomonas sp. PA1(2017)]